MKLMVVSLSPPGVKCQVGDFVMFVNPPSDRKASLILETKAVLPVKFPLSPEVVAGAGEYEVAGVRVKGVSLGSDSGELRTAYATELEGIHLAFLGKLEEEPASDALDKLGAVDILFFEAEPAKLKAKQLVGLIKQIGPKIIVPLGDKTAKLLSEELGQKVKAEEKLVIKKKDLEKEEIANKLIWLKN